MQADSFGSQHMTLARNGHVNRIVRLVGKSLELSRRLIAEHGARPGREHGRPQPAAAARYSGESGIDTGMDLPPAAAPNPELDHVHSESGPESLRARYNARLIPCQIAESRGKLTFHVGQCG